MKSVGTVLYPPPFLPPHVQCTQTKIGPRGAVHAQCKTSGAQREASMAEDRAPRSPPAFRTSSFHSGADFEAGRVGRARGEEAPLGADPPSPLGKPGVGRRRTAGQSARSPIDHQPDHRRNASPLQEFQLSLHVDRRMDQQHAEARRVPRRADSALWLMGHPYKNF